MPLYEYTCTSCGEEFEELVPINAPGSPPCPGCGSKVTVKKISLTGGISGGSSGGCGARSGFS